MSVCILTAPPTGCSSVSLPLLWPVCALRHNEIATATPAFNNYHPDQSAAMDPEATPSTSKKDYNSLKAQMMLALMAKTTWDGTVDISGHQPARNRGPQSNSP
ncbi:uncharacterized protein LOC144616199 [Panthera onca]